MTHTLHRRGDRESLGQDYIVFTMSAKKLNEEGSAERMTKFLGILLKHRPVNYGDMVTGNCYVKSREEIVGNIQSTSIVHGVFTDPAVVTQVLRKLKETDLGISVVASGLFEEIFQCCRKAGLSPHSVHYSLGVHGRVEKLPSEETMDIATMCGHALVSKNLVTKLVADIKQGKETGSSAAETLAKDCICGILNPVRAAKIMEAMSRL